MIRSQGELNRLLGEVIFQAKALGIPLSLRIDEDVRINQRARSRFGCCKKIQTPTLKGQSAKPGEASYIIEISKALSAAPEESIKEVLAHEVLHTTPGGYKHTGNWKNYAKLMNKGFGYQIKRTNSPESLGVTLAKERPAAKYLIVCQNCGLTMERARKSKVIKQPSLYRCKCGGRLKVSVVE